MTEIIEILVLLVPLLAVCAVGAWVADNLMGD